MPRRSKKQQAYRVRVKKGERIQSSRLVSSDPRNAASRIQSGRIVSVTKISPEEIGRYGEFFRLGPALMKEFAEERRQGRLEKSNREVRDGRDTRREQTQTGEGGRRAEAAPG